MDRYQQIIREELAKAGHVGMDPRWIEGYMRLDHGTLDALSRAQFARETREIAEMIAEAGGHSDEPERLARSYRL